MHCEEVGVLLTELLEEKLDPKTREAVSEHVAHCPSCQRDLAQIQQWQSMARQWRDDKVPEWSRAQFASPPSQKTPWLNWLSLATSTLAIVMVMAQVSVHSDEHGVHMTFGKPTPVSALNTGISEAQLDEKLATFGKLQQAKLENRFMELELAQTERDKRLLTAALNITREQSRDGYEQLVNYWQTVRQQDISTNQVAMRRLYSAQQTELNTLKASIRQTTVPEEL